ncbi:MAG: hypothetical protein AAGB22_15345, partial [Bacteroidota bacterium]
MQGESVNVSTIGKAVEREMDNVRTKVKEFGENTGPYRNRAKKGVDKSLDFVINLFTGFFRVFGKLMGGLFIALSIAVLASFVVGLFFPDDFFLVHAFDQENVNLLSWSDFLFPSSEVATLCMVGLTLAVLIPTIGLLYAGLRLLFKLQPGPRAIGPILGGLWFVSLVLLGIGTFQTARDFQVEAETGDVVALDSLTSDTLTLAMGNDVFGNGVVPTFRHRHQRRGRYYGHRDHLARFEGSRLLRGYPIVDVIRGTGDSIRVFVIRTAEGATQKLASGRSKHIEYDYTVSDNRLTLDSYFTIRQRDKWRDQEVEIVVELPVGKSIHLAPGMEYLIWDIDNVTNTWD